MSQKVVLLDLENNSPNIKLLHQILQHFDTLYVFNCTSNFEFALEDLTELATLITSGRIVVLDVPEAEHKEYEYAVLVGQLIALLEEDTHIEIISAMDSSDTLLMLLQSSDISCHLIQVEPEQRAAPVELSKFKLPSIQTINEKPDLQLVKKYCDILAKMSGKPNTMDSLKNSLVNILQIDADKAQHLLGLLMNLNLLKRNADHISFRKKLLKQWSDLDLNASAVCVKDLKGAIAALPSDADQNIEEKPQTAIQTAQQDLFRNFAKIDPIQVEVARKLRELNAEKPKDIYALRDLLEELFPKSDIRLLLKELIEKGYIYWNGHEVLYSHEMFLN